MDWIWWDQQFLILISKVTLVWKDSTVHTNELTCLNIVRSQGTTDTKHTGISAVDTSCIFVTNNTHTLPQHYREPDACSSYQGFHKMV